MQNVQPSPPPLSSKANRLRHKTTPDGSKTEMLGGGSREASKDVLCAKDSMHARKHQPNNKINPLRQNSLRQDRPSLTPEEQHELRQSLRGNRCRGRGRGRGQQKKPAGNTPMKKPSAQLQSMDSVELAAPSQGESDDAVPPVCKKPSMKATNETGQVIKRPAARKRAPPAENLEDRVFAKRRPPPNKGLPSYTKWCDLRDMFYEHIHPFVSQPSQKQVGFGTHQPRVNPS